jgi:protein gp37
MGVETKIEWCHHTFNPWWGCQRVSAGCEHCYAESFAKRVGQKVWGPEASRRTFGEKHWLEPRAWNAAADKAGERRRVFCASMADVFEDYRGLDVERRKLWQLIAETPSLDWLLLTKRPENMVKLAPDSWAVAWPRNVWAGTTVENQRAAEQRVPWLLEVPAAVRFLSCEPLLEQVDLENVRPYYLPPEMHPHDPRVRIDCLRGHVKGPDDMLDARIDWVIVGGESGNGARPFALEWAESLIDQCRQAGVRVFCKQLGAVVVSEERKIDGEWAWQAGLTDRKGGDWNEWPEHLRVRQFPEVRT